MVVTPKVGEEVWVPALRLLIGTAVGLVEGKEKENWLRLVVGATVADPELAPEATVGAGAALEDPLAGAGADEACLG